MSLSRDQLIPFRSDKECGRGYIEEKDTCHVGKGKPKRQTKAAKRKEEVAKAIAGLEKLSAEKLVKADIEDMAANLDIDDSQIEKAVDDLIEKRSNLLVNHAAQALKGTQMSAKFQEFAEDKFRDIFLSPSDALDDGWPIRSMRNALESPEKLNLWMRRQVSGWLEKDEIYENTGLPDDLFSMADEDALFKALKKSAKEAVDGVNVNKLHDSLSKYKPLAEKLPSFRREANKALDIFWDDAKAKYPFKMKTVRGKYEPTRVADNETNWKKVSTLSDAETEKWKERWAQEIKNAGLKPINIDAQDVNTERADNAEINKIKDALIPRLSKRIVNDVYEILDAKKVNKLTGNHYTVKRTDGILSIVSNCDAREVLRSERGKILTSLNKTDIKRFTTMVQKTNIHIPDLSR